MEKELKIAELANIWGVSVPTCWNRIKKEGLTTIKKKDETNKDITYITISDNVINKYIIKDNNNLNNNDNNGYYEELLTDNKVNNVDNSLNTSNLIDSLINLNKGYNEELKTVHNDYNNRLERLQEELITYKSKVPLLEDKANREGLYINEINELKKENNSKDKLIKMLITLIITLLTVIIISITVLLTLNYVNNSNNPETKNSTIEQVSTVENVNNEN